MTKGGRNLVILGVVSVVAALATTGVSLAWYHNSGDIYLDRSRPGFLPDEEEIESTTENKQTDFTFAESGAVDKTVIEEYIKNLEKELEELEKFTDPFNMNALTDETLGIN